MTDHRFTWLSSDPVRKLVAAFAGIELYFVGGSVRDTLLGREIGDFDLATPIHPVEVTRLAEAAGLRVIPTGIDHGTVTVLAENVPFEITTFRTDVETDGRHATVAFGSSLEEDAQRRDFTINAIYATPDGRIIDPVGGIPDVAARHVRFIGDPARRIAEDHLRILRFFRFHGDVANPDDGIDAEGLAACAEGAEGLEKLSAERITDELRKLLSLPQPAPSFGAMVQSGVAARVLPGADAAPLAMLIHAEESADHPPNWLRRLKSTGGSTSRLRLSKRDQTRLDRMSKHLDTGTNTPEIAYRDGTDVAWDVALIRASTSPGEPDATLKTLIDTAASATFPVTAADLMPNLSGPALGERLKQLETHWIASGFKATRKELLTHSE